MGPEEMKTRASISITSEAILTAEQLPAAKTSPGVEEAACKKIIKKSTLPRAPKAAQKRGGRNKRKQGPMYLMGEYFYIHRYLTSLMEEHSMEKNIQVIMEHCNLS